MTTAFHAPAGATDLPLEDIPEVLTQGGDWDDVLHEIEAITSERIVVNLGPVHPATHGVLRLILELDGEKVRETRVDTGYLHTGIEKNMEYRTWAQGVAYCTRMDYVAPFFQEAAYCLGVEKLLGIEEDIPERASLIRILMMELCRIASHLVAIGSTGNEMGATTIMTIGFRGREEILRIFERITGLRMNHEYIRPGGVVQDIGEGTTDYIRDRLRRCRKDIGELQDILVENPIFKKRLCDVAVMPLSGLMALGSTGPGVRAAGRAPGPAARASPTAATRTSSSISPPATSPTSTTARWFASTSAMSRCASSGRCSTSSTSARARPPWSPIPKSPGLRAWLSPRTARATRSSTSARLWGSPWSPSSTTSSSSRRASTCPPARSTRPSSTRRASWASHLSPHGGTRPFRAHFRDPSFANLQALAMMTEGGQLADVVVALAAIDPVLGGVDR